MEPVEDPETPLASDAHHLVRTLGSPTDSEDGIAMLE